MCQIFPWLFKCGIQIDLGTDLKNNLNVRFLPEK